MFIENILFLHYYGRGNKDTRSIDWRNQSSTIKKYPIAFEKLKRKYNDVDSFNTGADMGEMGF